LSTNGFRLGRAADRIRTGGLVAYPTEAVYGLGCDPLNAEAVERLLQLKQRDQAKGLILISDNLQRLLAYVQPLDEGLMAPVLASWPGPHTWLLPARPWVPRWIRGAHDSLAVRVTAHPLASALCRMAHTPLISTSANISTRTAARSPWQVRLQFGQRIDYLLTGPLGKQTRPTPIRDARNGISLRA
jgi:L-threonylcarbamoyladenylate synthase